MSIDKIHEITKIDQLFLRTINHIIHLEQEVAIAPFTREKLIEAKKLGFSDIQIARLWETEEENVYQYRMSEKVFPVYKKVDTCAAAYESIAPYFYSTYETENESLQTDRKKVLVLGSGPIRIGQGIEFDYATVHSVLAIKEMGYEAII